MTCNGTEKIEWLRTELELIWNGVVQLRYNKTKKEVITCIYLNLRAALSSAR